MNRSTFFDADARGSVLAARRSGVFSSKSAFNKAQQPRGLEVDDTLKMPIRPYAGYASRAVRANSLSERLDKFVSREILKIWNPES